MAKVTFEECRDYRDSLVKEAKDGKMSFTSAKQHMKHLKALFAFACDDIHIPADPMARVKLRFGGDGKKPADFTREDRRLILTLARESGNPVIYWLNWLGSFEGARLCELAEADTRDIVMRDGIWIIGIKRVIRTAEQGAKTTRSPRDLPLHSAVLDAKPKFFDYVDYVKDKFGEGPLFPQFNLDGYGRRNGPAGSLISNWFRSVVLPIGKIAEKKSFESHRHTAISCVRNMLTPDGHLAVKADVERYLFGHAPADVHARYGEQWTKTLKTAIENIPNPFL